MLLETRPLIEILTRTKEAWLGLGRKAYEASWLVCGFFSIQHFEQFRSVQEGISTQEEVQDCIDPGNVLKGGFIKPTPQFCPFYEWQIEDGRNITVSRLKVCRLFVLSWMCFRTISVLIQCHPVIAVVRLTLDTCLNRNCIGGKMWSMLIHNLVCHAG